MENYEPQIHEYSPKPTEGEVTKTIEDYTASIPTTVGLAQIGLSGD